MSLFKNLGEKQIKRSMLRGVFEENVRTFSPPKPPVKRMPRYLKASFVFAYIMLIAFFVNASSLNSTLRGSEPSSGNPPESVNISAALLSEPDSMDYSSLISPAALPLREVFGLGAKTIVIDPGHGGKDPGTSGRMGLQEKYLTLDIAKRLKKKLEQYGNLNIILTRTDDSTVSLADRTKLANKADADLFISVHVNYIPKTRENVLETYYFGISDDSDTLKLAAAENERSELKMSELDNMLKRFGDTLKLQESRELASAIQENLFLNVRGGRNDVIDWGVRRAPFVVLLGAEMPGVLAEVSCLSSADEERKLRTSSYRDDLASYLEYGIVNYLYKGEPGNGAKRGEI